MGTTVVAVAGRFDLTVLAPVDVKLETLEGIGAKTAARLRERDIHTARELLLFFPRKYQRVAHYVPGPDLVAQQRTHVEFLAPITNVRRPEPKTRQPVDVTLDHDGQYFRLLWFNMGRASFVRQLSPGSWMRVKGEVKYDKSIPYLLHPDFEILKSRAPEIPDEWTSVEAVYPSIEGVGDKKIRTAIRDAFVRLQPHLGDIIPPRLLELRGLPGVAQSLAVIHLLTDVGDADVFGSEIVRARNRIVYEEFYTLQHKLAQEYASSREGAEAPACTTRELGRELVAALPFKLTGDQRNAIKVIADDLGRTWPMRRLLQGDVGAGKTVVALMAAAIAVGSGQQAVFMAPTDILARQHLRRAQEFFLGMGVDLGFLGGSMPAADRRSVLHRLVSGDLDLLIGTHAVFQRDVDFHRLGLVIVDEQHKFGVEQRELLLAKGKDPHLLSMTATPIPRSLAHSVFGDLDLTIIREKPPGRQPIRTVLRNRAVAKKVYAYVRSQIEEHQVQAYFVYPMVEASEVAPGRQNVVDMHERLSNGPFAGLRVGLLHGRLPNETKDEVMRQFSEHELDVLCSTTVIEVGVDVPNATIMVIESPEVFGLSQLHQLRGRVGRGDLASMCVLLAGFDLTSDAEERLVSFRDTDDGFELSEADLKIRGPGLFLGKRQAGHAEFRFGDLFRDAPLLEHARHDAREEVLGGEVPEEDGGEEA